MSHMANDTKTNEKSELLDSCNDCLFWGMHYSTLILIGVLIAIIGLYIFYRRKKKKPNFRKIDNDLESGKASKPQKVVGILHSAPDEITIKPNLSSNPNPDSKINVTEIKHISELDQESKDEMIEKLSFYLQDKPDVLIKIICQIVKEESESSDGVSPTKLILQTLSFNQIAFEKYIDSLVSDVKNSDQDSSVNDVLTFVKLDLLDDQKVDQKTTNEKSKNFEKSDKNQKSKIKKIDPSMDNIDIRAIALCGQAGFARAWCSIPMASQQQIVRVLPLVLKNESALTVANNFIGNITKHNGIFGVALLSGYLSYETMKNIYLWYHGKITGKRVAKNLIDTSSVLIAGTAGGVVGAVVGGIAGPVGTITGGFLGSVAASAACSAMVDKLTQNFFGIPKDIAVENAYKFLGVNTKSSNAEINKAYKNLCLKFHPDKGGSAEDFNKLRASMGLIKVHRGEEY